MKLNYIILGIAGLLIAISGVYFAKQDDVVGQASPSVLNQHLAARGYAPLPQNPTIQDYEILYQEVYGVELVAWQTADGTEMCPQLPKGGRAACLPHWQQEWNNASENAQNVLQSLEENVLRDLPTTQARPFSFNFLKRFINVAMAAVEFNDTFSEETDGIDIVSHTPDTGTGWSDIIEVGTCSPVVNLNSFMVSVDWGCSDSEGALSALTDTLSNSDYTVAVTQTNGDTLDDTNQICARIQDSNNMYCFLWNEGSGPGGDLYSKTTASGWTEISSNCGDVADGSVVELIVSGTTISVEDDGTQICSVTNSDHSSAGKAGLGGGAVIISTDDGSIQQLDNFSVNVTAAAESTTFSNSAFGSNDALQGNTAVQ